MNEKIQHPLTSVGMVVNMTPMPMPVHAGYNEITNIIDFSKENDALIIHCNLYNTEKTLKLNVTFPTIGGIRFTNENTGFFEPESLKQFTYSKNGDAISVICDDTEYIIKFENGKFYIKNGEKSLALKLALGYSWDNILLKTYIQGDIAEDEFFYGLGERFNGFIRNNKSNLLWNIDPYHENMSEDPSIDKSYSYNNVPILHSTNGYTLFYNSTYSIFVDIGTKDKTKFNLVNDSNILDFYLWFGDSKDTLKQYTLLTGRTPIPPKWAFSYWAGNGACVWREADGEDGHLKMLEEILGKYKELGTMPAAVYGEGKPEKDPKAYEITSKYGTKMLGWWDSGLWKPEEVYDYIPDCTDEENPVVKRLSTNEIMTGNYLDFTNPNSKILLKRKLKEFFDMGLNGAMIDIADQVFVDSFFKNGMTGKEMHNFYAYHYTKTFGEVFREYWGNDCIMFARPGCAGSQRWISNFLGDQPANFMGMKQSLSAALSISASGFSVWGSDMGGYGTNPHNAEVYRRWTQWSTFNPLMRAHGLTRRNPWDYNSEEAIKDFIKYYWLRENILNVSYSGAIESNKTATPMTQPLQVAFPGETKLYNVEDEYLYCNELLVAPVTEEGITGRPVVLPSGIWTDFWSGEHIVGDKTIDVDAPIDKIPVYIRSGAVLPIRLTNTLEMYSPLGEDTVESLLVTPTENRREVRFWRDEDTEARFIMESIGNKNIITSLDEAKERVIVFKGVKVKSVIADGVELSLTSESSFDKNGFIISDSDTKVILSSGGWKTVTVEI